MLVDRLKFMICKNCNSKMNKYGFNISRKGRIQKYQCISCGAISTEPLKDTQQIIDISQFKTNKDKEKYLNELIPLDDYKLLIVRKLNLIEDFIESHKPVKDPEIIEYQIKKGELKYDMDGYGDISSNWILDNDKLFLQSYKPQGMKGFGLFIILKKKDKKYAVKFTNPKQIDSFVKKLVNCE